MPKYPDSYCIKCKKHTQTLGKHTILLSNKRRVLKGICPTCSSETYRFMPNPKLSNASSRHISLLKSKKQQKETLQSLGSVEVPLYSSPVKDLSWIERFDPGSGRKMKYWGIYLLVSGLLVSIILLLKQVD